MIKLHVFKNDVVEKFVAESLEEVKQIAREYHIENYGTDEETIEDYLDFEQEPDDKVMSIIGDEISDSNKETMTCGEFATKYGKGFLCTTEY